MSRGRIPPIIACAFAALIWNCGGSAKSPGAPPAPVAVAPAPSASPPATALPSDVRSTRSGVFTDEQATQGREVYSAQCVSCHAGDHIGGNFRRRWSGMPLSNLYGLIVETMPQDNPGSLSRDDYVRVIAYLLKANGMPGGETPLPTDSLALTKIRLDTLAPKH
jgi:mono/diheme cytochrome c family protein